MASDAGLVLDVPPQHDRPWGRQNVCRFLAEFCGGQEIQTGVTRLTDCRSGQNMVAATRLSSLAKIVQCKRAAQRHYEFWDKAAQGSSSARVVPPPLPYPGPLASPRFRQRKVVVIFYVCVYDMLTKLLLLPPWRPTLRFGVTCNIKFSFATSVVHVSVLRFAAPRQP